MRWLFGSLEFCGDWDWGCVLSNCILQVLWGSLIFIYWKGKTFFISYIRQLFCLFKISVTSPWTFWKYRKFFYILMYLDFYILFCFPTIFFPLFCSDCSTHFRVLAGVTLDPSTGNHKQQCHCITLALGLILQTLFFQKQILSLV